MKNALIFNPDSEDFTITYDINGDGIPLSYTLHSLEAESFPQAVADHIRNHLAKHLVFKRGIKTNFDDDYQKVLTELTP